MGLNKREAERRLKKAGFECITGGPHDKWVHADGRMVTMPHGRGNMSLYGWLEVSLRKVLEGKEGKRSG